MLQSTQAGRMRNNRRRSANLAVAVRIALQKEFDRLTNKAVDDAGEKRIRHLLQLIDGLAMIDNDVLWDSRAGYGSVVELRDLDSGMDLSYTLMAGALIDLDFDQVSLGSPVGQALLGAKAGDQAVVATPHGKRRYRVLSIETLPNSLGLTSGR